MTCRHCHVDAGPDRADENMDRETIEACLRRARPDGARTRSTSRAARRSSTRTSAISSTSACARGKHVIDRCNLTILLARRAARPARVARRARRRGRVLAAALPEAEHGRPARRRHVRAVHRGAPAAERRRLRPGRSATPADARVATPSARSCPANQASLEREWKAGLARRARDRVRPALLPQQHADLAASSSGSSAEREPRRATWSGSSTPFNPATVDGLMCRNTLSIGWDGRVYDCDFNQMLDLPASGRRGRAVPRPRFRPRPGLAARGS